MNIIISSFIFQQKFQHVKPGHRYEKNAPMRSRTADLMITSHALYQLSYESSHWMQAPR